jgi:regulator of protease activity HflC (stomatin/prohibitin superfamily)
MPLFRIAKSVARRTQFANLASGTVLKRHSASFWCDRANVPPSKGLFHCGLAIADCGFSNPRINPQSAFALEVSMTILHRIKIRSYELGLVFRDGEFARLLGPGRRWIIDLLGRTQVQIVSQRAPWLVHEQLDQIVKSGALKGRALILDLKDHERALVWIDGRFSHILPPGQHAFWTGQREVRTEVVDARTIRFEHKELAAIVGRGVEVARVLDVCQVEPGHAGVLLVDGKLVETLAPGRYALWKNVAAVKLVALDLRETVLDVAGQEIMTADKVTLRINAGVTYRIVDPVRAVSATDDVRQALYREVQHALRAAIGARELDALLAGKDEVGREVEQALRARATELGLALTSVGIRDIVLPGDMRELMNKVTEAKKAAEANLIARREETAAIRSQANTAKLLVEHPTLMRLRELEVLEKIAAAGNLKVVLEGEQRLADRVTNLL